MADYFIDTGLTTGSNNGSDFDNVWQELDVGVEYVNFTPTDIIWTRRRSSFSGATSNIQPNADSDGSLKNWIQVVAWPRAELSGTATFAHGSTVISSPSFTAVRERHVGRKLKNNADGRWYIITHVFGGSFIIDRKYVGSSAVGSSFTIEKDEHYDQAQAIDDSAWTIKKTDWNADPDDLPVIDFESTAYYLYFNGAYMWRLVGLNIKGGSSRTIYARTMSNLALKYCLLEQSNSAMVISLGAASTSVFLDQCIFRGSGSGASQSSFYGYTGNVIFRNGAINNMGGYGLGDVEGNFELNNVNIGVEEANAYADVNTKADHWHWKNVKLGGTNGEVADGIYYRGSLNIENFGKELSVHKSYNNNGTYTYIDVDTTTTDPRKRTGGADTVIRIIQNQSDNSRSFLFKDSMLQVFEHRFKVDTTSRNYRYYVQADALAITDADEFFIEAEYVDQYDASDEYHMTTVRSDETITARSGVTDWTQYIEVTGIQSAVAGWVTIRLYCGIYDADGSIYVDPKAALS